MFLVRRGAKQVQVDVENSAGDALRIVYAGGMGGWHAFDKKRRGSLSRRLFQAWENLGKYELVRLDYRGHSPVYVGKAVKQVLKRRPEWEGRIAVEIYGNRFPQHTIDKLLKGEEIDDVVKVHGVLPHEQVLKKVFGADVLFMALPEHKDGSPDPRISSKTYEYLMSGRPILAGLPPGENRNFLSNFDGTHIVEPKDVAGMAAAIEMLAARHFDGEPLAVDRTSFFPLLSVDRKAAKFESIVNYAIDPAHYAKPEVFEKGLEATNVPVAPFVPFAQKKKKGPSMIKRIVRGVATRLLRPLGKTGVLGTITHVKTKSPLVSLTFDDGPDPEYTPKLLAILDKFKAKATFFMVGESAEKYPEIVRQVSEAGHTVANHTWNHPSLRFTTGYEAEEQIKKCSAAISPYENKILRPPWGELSLSSRYKAFKKGYKVVTWNAHAQDWIEPDAEKMTERLINEIKPGSIVLLHDTIYTSRNDTAQHDRGPLLKAVEDLLSQTSENFQYVTLPELLEKGEPVFKRVGW